MRRSSALLGTVALLAVAAGCGGGGGNDADRLTRAQLATRANVICARVHRETNALPEPKTLDQLADGTGKVKKIFDEGIADMKELVPPEAIEDDFNEFIEISERESELLTEISSAARDGDRAEVRRLVAEGEREDNRADSLARSFGARQCAT